MKKNIITLLSIFLLFASCKNETKTDTAKAKKKEIVFNKENLEILPIKHATLVLNYKTETIYIDPTGGKDAFEGQKQATYVLITDIHGDHLNIKTLEALDLSKATLIGPKAVIDKLPETIAKTLVTINNGDTYTPEGFFVEAIPMYNLPEDETSRHPKGRGNGYILTLADQRIYISGDTEDIPEMRNLKNIDKAFVCMNLPYTMTIDSAASAVLDFKPKQVYPFHYRGKDGLSDVAKFKTLVNKGNTDIEVVQLDWYLKN